MHYLSYSPSREKLLSKASLASGRRIGYFMAAVGLILLAWGEYLFIQERRFLSHAQYATAHLVDWQASRTRMGLRYAPVFAYSDSTGKQWRIVSDRSASAPNPAVEQSINVIYPADDPGKGQMEGFFARWGATICLVGIGTVLAAVGYVGTGIFEWLERTTFFP